MTQDVDAIRADFPALRSMRGGQPPVYLDSAAGSLIPEPVLQAMHEYYTLTPSCSGRGGHWWAAATAENVLEARRKVAHWLNASDADHPDGPRQVVFTRNTTEALNLVARALHWEPGDVVVTGDREHNSNRCPWQDLRQTHGVERRVIARDDSSPDADANAAFDVDFFLNQLDRIPNVKLVSLAQTANLDGHTISDDDLRRIIRHCHDRDDEIYVMLDSAQAAPHRPLDVAALDVDFLGCSVHKMLGPTGMGVCYMKDPELLVRGRFPSGGGTVTNTRDDPDATPEYAAPPERYEAGLQNWAGIIGAGAAVEYLTEHMEFIQQRDAVLNARLTTALLPYHHQGDITILGPLDPAHRGCVCTFEVTKRCGEQGADIVNALMSRLNERNIMVRTGDFCVHPYCHRRDPDAARFRASVYLYNTEEECDAFIGVVTAFLDERPSA